MLLETIKKDLLTTRKAREDRTKIDLLTTFVGEISKNGVNSDTSDLAVVTLLKKFLDNATDTYQLQPSEGVAYEIEILRGYLPKQLSEAEIVEIIKTLPDTSNIGPVMKAFKAAHAGLYDAAVVKRIWTQLQPA